MAGIIAPTTDALALWDDRLELFVAEKVTRDDNVFRVSSSRDPTPLLGSSSKGDTFYTTSLGLNFDVPVSRQRFQGGMAVNDIRYDRFTVLNLTGHDVRAAWLWQAGDDLAGQVGYTESLALASLANVQSGVQSGRPNPLLARRGFFNAEYRLSARWRLGGELSRLQQANDAAERKVNDVNVDGASATMSYVTPANNRIGVMLRDDQALYPNPQIVAGTPFDNAYRQRTVALVSDWTITGHSHLKAQAGWVRRSYEQLPQRDIEIPTFRATYDWKPTGKLTLVAVALREISSTEEVTIGHVVAKGVALRPTLRVTDKFDIGGALESGEKKYQGDPAMVLGLIPERTDRVRAAEVTAAYRPLRTVRLEMAWRRESRTSTDVLGDYKVNVFSVSARLGF